MDLVSEYVDTATAAELLGVQPDTVRRYVASGTLKAVRFGRSLMIHKGEIERYAKESRWEEGLEQSSCGSAAS
jgi:excisionase family DNA binding protein